MRRALLCLVILAAPAFADAPSPPPELVVTWETGEMSRDMSIWRTEISVTGSKLHYARTYHGRNSGMPGTKPGELDATVKDPKKVAAALAALDKLKVKKAAPSKGGPERFNLRSGCVTRGKAQRCASSSGDEPDSDEVKAIAAVRDALLDGLALPGALTLSP